MQAPREFIENYRGRFDAGWRDLRTERHKRAQALGLIPAGAPLAPMPEDARDWRTLSETDRRLYAARMEVNAAMLEAMDHHVGRFVDHLKATRQFENTIFVITSDNGPEPNRGDNDWRLSLWMRANGYHAGLDGMGGKGSWGFIGPEWANAAASPGALYKFYATEGGVRAPLIIAGPGIPRSRISSPVMVTDIAPTLIEWLGAPPAPEGARAMTGRTLFSVLKGMSQSAYAPGDVRVIEVSGNSALYRYDYKITRNMPPVGDGKWRLYNLAADPGETTDLSAQHPDILETMVAEYAAYAARHGVWEMPPGYDSHRQVERNSLARSGAQLAALGPAALSVLLLVLGGVWALRRRRSEGKRALPH